MLDFVQLDLQKAGLRLQRIDGQTPLLQRRAAVARFSSDVACTVMLASIGSAGEGWAALLHIYLFLIVVDYILYGLLTLILTNIIDLISACHVHILEPQWNPMVEAQAIGRVHRIGQSQQVFVTRYIVRRSIENVSYSISLPFQGPSQKDNFTQDSQYIQWVQKDKMRVISHSLDFGSLLQADIDQQRWQVSWIFPTSQFIFLKLIDSFSSVV